MHDTANLCGKLFFDLYWRTGFRQVVDIGSYDVNGTLRPHCPPGVAYLGVDLVPGPGVDIVAPNMEEVPVADATGDLVLSTSTFEHADAFWLTFLEMARVLKPGGFLYINAPSNGVYHRYPNDNWRFFPDAGPALERWAARSGQPVVLVESFVAERMGDIFNDFVAVFAKPGPSALLVREFISDHVPRTNLWRFGESRVLKERGLNEDLEIIQRLTAENQRLAAEVAQLREALAAREPLP